MSKEYKPYTYLLGWSSLDVYYYGVEYGRKSKIANPSNLWTSYFSSSDRVKETRSQYGDPDIIQVRKVFDCPHKAIEWENKVLKRLNVLQYPEKWLNRNIAGLFVMTDDIANKISNTMKGTMPKVPLHKQIMSPEVKANKAAKTSERMKKNNPMKTAEQRKKKSELMKSKPGFFIGKTHSEETKLGWSKKRKGVKRSQESIEKQRLQTIGMFWVHKNGKNTKIRGDQLELYLANSWQRGMSKRC
jgi:hypothetical protein